MMKFDRDFIKSIIEKYGDDLSSINLSSNGLRSLSSIEMFAANVENLNLSRNEIKDLFPLMNLKNLKFLDLSDNMITDISPLQSLLSLVHLNISNNFLDSVNDLKFLIPLKNLNVINLQGNPLCLTVNYPSSVFQSLNQIKYIDNMSRLEYTDEKIQSFSTKDINKSTDLQVYIPTEEDIMYDDVASLKAQLHAMELAFEAQEKAVSRRMQSSSVPTSNQTKVIEESEFPYTELLQLWRRQAVRNIFERLQAESSSSMVSAKAYRERTELTQRIIDADAAAVMWKQRFRAYADKMENVENQLDILQQSLHSEINRRAQAEAELTKKVISSDHFDKIFHQLRNAGDEGNLRAQSVIFQCLERLKDMENRLVTATNRLQAASVLFAQKEIFLRNSLATMNVEKRISTLQFSSPASANKKDSKHYDSQLNDNLDEDVDTPPEFFLSDLVLKPEAEALLRSLFRMCDQNDSGTVTIGIFIDFFCGDGDEKNQLQRIVKTALGSYLWSILVTSLQTLENNMKNSSEGIGLTWGEFLSLLIPGGYSSHQPRTPLSKADMKALREAGIWGDEEWCMIPLSLPITDGDSNIKHMNLKLSPDSAMKEVERLSRERTFLLSRLQNMGRTLDRRTEAVKACFEAELSKGRIREGRLKSQVTELQGVVSIQQDRLAELEMGRRADIERLETRLHRSEEECLKLQSELRLTKDEMILKTEAIATEEHAKLMRLEMEHNLLQRESAKKEVKCKGLQRDTLRLQTALSSTLEDMKSLREKLDKVESEIGHERIAAKGMKEEINGYKIENDTLRTENFELREKIDLLEKEYQKLQDISKGTQFHDDDTIPTDVSLKPGMSVVKASQMKAEDAVREEMEFVRSLPLYQKQHQRIENENLKQNFDNLDKTQSSSSAKEEKYSSGNDVYTAHLTRLLRLAEEAIHRN